MKSLGNRIAVVAGVSAATIIVLLALVISITLRNTFLTFENLQSAILSRDYDRLIRNQVETAVSLLNYHYSRYRSGAISLDEAQRDAADALRELRYGEEGYFWADTVEGVNVVLLGRDTEGTNRLNASDVKGFEFIREIIDAGTQPGGGYTDEAGNFHYTASFAGFFPAEEPELSMVVVIDEPQTSIFGGDAAAPLFAELAQFALRRFRVPPPAAPEGVAPAPPVETDDQRASEAANGADGDGVPG